MLADPDLILLDEPFAALDAEGVGDGSGADQGGAGRRRRSCLPPMRAIEIEGVDLGLFKLESNGLTPFKEETRRRALRSLLRRRR